MMGLSDGERISVIRSAVLIQYTRVTDGRTDRQTELAWHIRAIAYMLSRVIKTEHCSNSSTEEAEEQLLHYIIPFAGQCCRRLHDAGPATV